MLLSHMFDVHAFFAAAAVMCAAIDRFLFFADHAEE
jgi:hypothetical protein